MQFRLVCGWGKKITAFEWFLLHVGLDFKLLLTFGDAWRVVSLWER